MTDTSPNNDPQSFSHPNVTSEQADGVGPTPGSSWSLPGAGRKAPDGETTQLAAAAPPSEVVVALPTGRAEHTIHPEPAQTDPWQPQRHQAPAPAPSPAGPQQRAGAVSGTPGPRQDGFMPNQNGMTARNGMLDGHATPGYNATATYPDAPGHVMRYDAGPHTTMPHSTMPQHTMPNGTMMPYQNTMMPTGQGPLGKVRSTPVCILLTVVTLGFFAWYWTYAVSKEMKAHCGQGVGGPVAALLFWVPFATFFMVPSEVSTLYSSRGKNSPVSAAAGCWVFLPIAGQLVWFFQVNAAINNYWMSMGAAPNNA